MPSRKPKADQQVRMSITLDEKDRAWLESEGDRLALPTINAVVSFKIREMQRKEGGEEIQDLRRRVSQLEEVITRVIVPKIDWRPEQA